MVTLSQVLRFLYAEAVPAIDFIVSDDGTGPQITHWNTAKLGPQPTEQELAAVTQEQLDAARLDKLRATAKQFQDDLQAQNVALRVVVKLMVNENNALRNWLTDFKAVVAAANSLAALKTGVAGLPNMPERTYAQARNAIGNLTDAEGN